MFLRPKIAKIAQKSMFFRSRFFDYFLGCQKTVFSLILGPKTERRHPTFWLFFRCFSSFSPVLAFSAILGDFSCPRRPKMSRKRWKNKPHHQPRHQLLATSATLPATNQHVWPTKPHKLSCTAHGILTNPSNWMGGRWFRLCWFNPPAHPRDEQGRAGPGLVAAF